MTWYKYCKIRRIIDSVKIPWFLWLCLGSYQFIYQHGIQLINEKGETKDVWEKLETKTR